MDGPCGPHVAHPLIAWAFGLCVNRAVNSDCCESCCSEHSSTGFCEDIGLQPCGHVSGVGLLGSAETPFHLLRGPLSPRWPQVHLPTSAGERPGGRAWGWGEAQARPHGSLQRLLGARWALFGVRRALWVPGHILPLSGTWFQPLGWGLALAGPEAASRVSALGRTWWLGGAGLRAGGREAGLSRAPPRCPGSAPGAVGSQPGPRAGRVGGKGQRTLAPSFLRLAQLCARAWAKRVTGRRFVLQQEAFICSPRTPPPARLN